MPTFIAGIFRDRGLAERVVTALLDAGIPSSEVSLAVREREEEDVNVRDELVEEGGEYAELAIHSAWERLGWLGGARPAYRDKVPPDIEFAILTAGPLAIAIGGAQVGAAAGGVVGGMANFGYPLDLTRRWYNRILDGAAWLMVRTTEEDKAKVWQIFDRYAPELPGESLRRW